MSTLLWLLTEAGLVLCWLVTPWAPAPWLALCWLMAPLAGWLALLLTRKRSQVRLTCPVTAEKGKPFSVTAEVRQGVPFGRGRLTVSVENTVTGETHREKLTLHQGRVAATASGRHRSRRSSRRPAVPRAASTTTSAARNVWCSRWGAAPWPCLCT